MSAVGLIVGRCPVMFPHMSIRVPTAWRRRLVPAVPALAMLSFAPARDGRILDDFTDVSAWRAYTSPGATFALAPEAGALRVDFTVPHGRAWAVVRRALSFEFPDDYTLSYRVRGPAQAQLQVRVHGRPEWTSWTANARDSIVAAVWDTVRFQPRHLEPAAVAAARPDSVMFVDFVIVPGAAGTGTLWIDDLMLEERAEREPDSVASVRASTFEYAHPPERATDGDSTTGWRSAADLTQWLAIDLPERRTLGGIVLDWGPEDYAAHYEVMLSSDGVRWISWYQALDADGGRDWIPLPDAETRHVRIDMIRSGRGAGYALREVGILSHEEVPTRDAFHGRVARESTAGLMPRGLTGATAPWVPLGLPADTLEALLSEDGAIELPRGNASLEPFLLTDPGLRTWTAVQPRTRLVEGDLPIASVRWQHADSLELQTTAFVTGAAGAATLFVRYRVENRGAAPRPVVLFVAIRPFAVAPRADRGIVGRIDEVSWDGYAVTVDGTQRIVPLVPPTTYGGTTAARGDIVESLAKGELPAVPRTLDPNGMASAALAFELDVPAGGARDAILAVPFDSASVVPEPGSTMAESADAFVQAMTASAARWRAHLDASSPRGPAQAEDVLRTFRSSIAWIDIVADGARIQSGARRAEAAFLPSGALTAATLLRLGRHDAVRDYVDLFARAQTADGRIPCCIDARGAVFDADESATSAFLQLIADYHRYSGDVAFVERLWPAVEGAAIALERRLAVPATAAEEDEPPIRGPVSLHETGQRPGTDTLVELLLAARGIAGAEYIAEVLGRTVQRDRWTAVREGRAAPALAAAARTTDPLTAATLVRMGGEQFALGAEDLRSVLESGWSRIAARADDQSNGDAFSAHELRLVSAFARLTWKARAIAALSTFLDARSPWNQWAEVEGPATPDSAAGDHTHAGVAADYIAAVLDLFAFERERDETLVVAAGIPDGWLSEGTGVSLPGISTQWGRLDLSLRAEGPRVHIAFGEGLRAPPGGIEVHSPLGRPITRATADGRTMPIEQGAIVRLDAVPAELILYY